MRKLKSYPIIAIIKVTKACNLSCRYCCEEKRFSIMDEKTLENSLAKVIRYNDKIAKENSFDKAVSHCIFHGGEPLSMKKEFFEKVIEIEKKHTRPELHRVENSIQTNLTLLTPDLWSFFKKEGFRLGSSLDGNSEMNDLERGAGTFDRIMRAINLTRPNTKAKSPIGCICILTKEKLNKISEIYDFFKSNNINFEINPLVITGDAKKNRIEAVTPEEWAYAMVELFDIWFHDKKEPFIEIPFLSRVAAGFLSGNINSCTFGGTCRNRYISINPNGDVYPCGKFGAGDTFKLGNINEHSVTQIIQSSTNRYLLTRNADNIQGCKSCDFKEICKGGCFYNAFLETGDPLGKDSLCKGYKIIYSHIKKALGESLKDLGSQPEKDKERNLVGI